MTTTETRPARKPKQSTRTIITAAAYIGAIIFANWLVAHFGIINMGFGLQGPAGVYMIGVTLVLRDLLQDRVGPARTIPFMLIGAAISAFFSPALALASAAAFLAAEFMDMAVYTPLRARGHILAAVLASNIVGLLLDTFIFLNIAFGSIEFWEGQVVGKIIGTLFAACALPLIYRGRKDKRPHYVKQREREATYV